MELLDNQPDFKGDKEHLKVFLEAIRAGDPAVWNTWKEKNRKIKPDLRGINLNKDLITLSKLYNYNFEKVILRDSSFYRQTIEKSNFNYADMENVDLSESIINNSSFIEANLVGCNLIATLFKRSVLRNTRCLHSIFMKAHFFQTDLSGISLFGTYLEHCSIKECKCEFIYIDKDGNKRMPETGELTNEEIISFFTKKHYVGE